MLHAARADAEADGARVAVEPRDGGLAALERRPVADGHARSPASPRAASTVRTPCLERRQLGRGDHVGAAAAPRAASSPASSVISASDSAPGRSELGGRRALGGKHVVRLVDDRASGAARSPSARWPPSPAPWSRTRPSRSRLIALRSSTRLVARVAEELVELVGRRQRAARPCRRTRPRARSSASVR